MKFKQQLFFLLFFTLLLLMPSIAFADQDLVNDQANLFTDEQKQTLETELQVFYQKTGMTGVIVTTNDAEGKTSQDYADDFYDDQRYGTDEGNSGFLLLIDLDNRKLYLSTSGKMINTLNDRRIERILDKSIPYMSNKEYAKACSTAVAQIQHYYTSDQPGFTPLKVIIACSLGILSTIGIFLFIISRYQLKSGKYQYPFREKSTVFLTDETVIFINSFITTRRIPRNNNSGGGGSSTHMSGGGHTHGGGGRSF